jgi:YVTN family beta-propeller protein
VTPISTATNKAGKAIGAGPGPIDIAITPDGKTAYVADFGAGNGDTVTAISTATGKVIKTITVGGGPVFIAIAR